MLLRTVAKEKTKAGRLARYTVAKKAHERGSAILMSLPVEKTAWRSRGEKRPGTTDGSPIGAVPQGYDASGKDDEELPPEQQEQSDDEAERMLKNKGKAR